MRRATGGWGAVPIGMRHATPSATAAGPLAARRKFLRFFPDGFRDETYLEWERNYKWAAHEEWERLLNEAEFRRLLLRGAYAEIAARAVRVEAKTNLLFSFEKMAIRDGIKPPRGARRFAEGLGHLLFGPGPRERRFDRWCEALAGLPRRQTRLLTWPTATVFGFLAQPAHHIFLKPNVTKRAAAAYGFEFPYVSRPSGRAYATVLEFSRTVQMDLRDLAPRDQIDIQSFIWVQGSDEYD